MYGAGSCAPLVHGHHVRVRQLRLGLEEPGEVRPGRGLVHLPPLEHLQRHAFAGVDPRGLVHAADPALATQDRLDPVAGELASDRQDRELHLPGVHRSLRKRSPAGCLGWGAGAGDGVTGAGVTGCGVGVTGAGSGSGAGAGAGAGAGVATGAGAAAGAARRRARRRGSAAARPSAATRGGAPEPTGSGATPGTTGGRFSGSSWRASATANEIAKAAITSTVSGSTRRLDTIP